MGAEGSSIAWREEGEIPEIRLPAYNLPVVNSTGCGDAYSAGYIVGLTNCWDLERCGRLGTAASALVITGLGSDAGIVDLAQPHSIMEHAEAHVLSLESLLDSEQIRVHVSDRVVAGEFRTFALVRHDWAPAENHLRKHP